MHHGSRKKISSRIAIGALFATLFWTIALPSQAAPLTIVNVGAPDINCNFDSDCTITVNDSADHFTLAATSGDAFLQTRTFPVGQAGTAGAGWYAYLYRIDLRQLAGLTALPCVNSLKITFGPVKSLDYNSDGTPDQVFVVTTSGQGSSGRARPTRSATTSPSDSTPRCAPAAARATGNPRIFRSHLRPAG